MQPRFRGIFIPLITPFHDDGEVDFDALAEVTEFMIERKVHGLFVIGSTGMGPVMTTEQRIKTAEFAVNQVRRRVPVTRACSSASKRKSEIAPISRGISRRWTPPWSRAFYASRPGALWPTLRCRA
jgi:dihydrodipicolinate synthase/N-acetylneuraminate lyase